MFFFNYSGTSVAQYCNIHHIKGIYFLYPMQSYQEIQAKHIKDGNLKEIFYSGLSLHFMSKPCNFLHIFKTLRADQRKTAMYRGSNRIQIAARVNIMHPKKFGDHHRDENMDYRRDGGVQKGNCDNYLHLAIHFSGQYPRAKIFCTRMFYFPVTH